MTAVEKVAKAILDTFISPNEVDRNLESANVVDGLYFIGRGLHRIADAIEQQQEPTT